MSGLCLLVLSFLFLISCKSRVHLRTLQVNEECIYYEAGNKSKKPYTGYVYSTSKGNFRNDTNSITCLYHFKNGIPSGEYKIYDHGNLLWKGNQTIILEVKDLQNHFPSLKRLNIDRTQDNPTEIVVCIITANPSGDSVNLELKKPVVIDYLLKHKYLAQKEIALIDTFIVSLCEISEN